jgi:hypothetical protein
MNKWSIDGLVAQFENVKWLIVSQCRKEMEFNSPLAIFSILLRSLFIFGPWIMFWVSPHDFSEGKKTKPPMTECRKTGRAFDDWGIITVYETRKLKRKATTRKILFPFLSTHKWKINRILIWMKWKQGKGKCNWTRTYELSTWIISVINNNYHSWKTVHVDTIWILQYTHERGYNKFHTFHTYITMTHTSQTV